MAMSLARVFERRRQVTVAHRLVPHHGDDRSEHQDHQARGDTHAESGECDGEHEHRRSAGQE